MESTITMQNVKLDIPLYSQHTADVPEEWRRQACGITVLKMALEYLASDHSLIRANKRIVVPSTGELIEEGVALGGYLERVGWKHDALVALAEKYGVEAHRAEFKDDKQRGVKELRRALEEEVLPAVSVSTDHNNPSTFHLVALTGYDENGFFYNDPAHDETKGKDQFIPYADFERTWRGLSVFFGA